MWGRLRTRGTAVRRLFSRLLAGRGKPPLDVGQEHVHVLDQRRVRVILLEGAELVRGAQQVALLEVDLAGEEQRALDRIALLAERRQAADGLQPFVKAV